MPYECIHGQKRMKPVGVGVSTSGHPGGGTNAETGGQRGYMRLNRTMEGNPNGGAVRTQGWSRAGEM